MNSTFSLIRVLLCSLYFRHLDFGCVKGAVLESKTKETLVNWRKSRNLQCAAHRELAQAQPNSLYPP